MPVSSGKSGTISAGLMGFGFGLDMGAILFVAAYAINTPSTGVYLSLNDIFLTIFVETVYSYSIAN